MPIKIAVVGAHSSGKTTLAQRLADELAIPLIPEASRIAAKNHGIENLESQRLGMDFQWDCLHVQERNEYRYASWGFVTDRGWPDYVAYPLLLRTFSHRELSGYLTTIRLLSRDAYDLVVQPLIQSPIEDDGFRHGNLGLQAAVDELVWMITPGLVCREQLRVIGGLEERASQVHKHIERIAQRRLEE